MFIFNIIIFAILSIPLILITTRVLGEIYWKAKAKKEDWATIIVRPNRTNEKNPNVAEQIFAALHGIYNSRNFLDVLTGKPQDRISFELANTDGKVHFFIRCKKEFIRLVEGQIYAHYYDSEIEIIEDYARKKQEELSEKDFHVIGAEIKFTDSDIWPIKRYSQFEDKIARTVNDPISGLLLPLSQISQGENAWIQMICTPMSSTWFRRRGTKCLQILEKGHHKTYLWLQEVFEKKFMTMWFWKRFLNLPILGFFWILRGGSSGTSLNLDSSRPNDDPDLEMSRSHERESDMTAGSDKISRLPYNTTIRIIYFPSDENLALSNGKIREVAGGFKQFNLPQLNGFRFSKITKDKKFLRKYVDAEISGQMIMSIEELASIYHLPNTTSQVPCLDWVISKKLEPPGNLPIAIKSNKETLDPSEMLSGTTKDGEKITLIGDTNFRGKNENFGIKTDDRRRHIYIVGKTGMGKSTLLENMIFSDIHSGNGIAVVDPHGDLADAVMDFVPPSRTNNVVLFDPSDTEYPVSFNMLECPNPNNRHLVASGVIGVFKKIFGESWGPRLEHILRNTLLALIEAPNTTMLGIMRMLVDDKYRRQILKSVTDPMVLSFWNDEFGNWQAKQVTEAISPIQNKVGQFLSSSMTRNILGQPKSSIDLRFAMDRQKIIIINLSKGKIGEDNSALLGSMLITKFQLDVMSRADIAEKERKDFYLYVDEFQNFATDAFATILSEARKYRLNLTVANQYLAQMPEEVRDAIFGNVGSMVSFQVGFDDAEVLANQFGGEDGIVQPEDIGGLPKYQIYLRLMIDGMPSNTFSAATLPPPDFEIEENRREKLMKVCRERYSRPRAEVEDKIKRWSQGRMDKNSNDS